MKITRVTRWNIANTARAFFTGNGWSHDFERARLFPDHASACKAIRRKRSTINLTGANVEKRYYGVDE